MCVMHLCSYEAKQPNLMLKTWPKQLLHCLSCSPLQVKPSLERYVTVDREYLLDIYTFKWIYQFEILGRFVKQKLRLICSLRCDQINSNDWYEFGHTFLCFLHLTRADVFNKLIL
jgi:hypothetical protein